MSFHRFCQSQICLCESDNTPHLVLAMRRAHEKPVLLSFARHYQTNESMPDDLVNKVEATRNYR